MDQRKLFPEKMKIWRTILSIVGILFIALPECLVCLLHRAIDFIRDTWRRKS